MEKKGNVLPLLLLPPPLNQKKEIDIKYIWTFPIMNNKKLGGAFLLGRVH